MDVVTSAFGASFLDPKPGLPPAQDGEPWGAEELTLHFIGGPYRFHGLSRRQHEQLGRRFAGLLGGGGGDTCLESHVQRLPVERFLHPPTRGWELSMDLDYEPRHVRAASLRLLADLEWSASGASGGSLWTCVAEGEEFLGVFENYFRLLVAYRLLALGGVLLHSSAVVVDGRAVVFFGPSGAGKTTVARLGQAAGHGVLSDDMNALCPTGSAVVVERLPFAGELAGEMNVSPRAGIPLGALLRLRQGTANHLRPLAPAAGLASLLACAPFVNQDPHRLPALLANLETLARSGVLGELEFRREGGFWSLLRGEPWV